MSEVEQLREALRVKEGELQQAQQDAALVVRMRADGKDPQVIADAYGWTVAEDHTLHGLVAGDMGYEPSGLSLDHYAKEWLKRLEGSEERAEKAEQQLTEALAERDRLREYIDGGVFDVETPCPECRGLGRKTYGSTATWRGGIGGQAMTQGVCDKCWGSGEADKPWKSWREIESLSRQLSTLQEQVKGLRDALDGCVSSMSAAMGPSPTQQFQADFNAACDALRLAPSPAAPLEQDELSAEMELWGNTPEAAFKALLAEHNAAKAKEASPAAPRDRGVK